MTGFLTFGLPRLFPSLFSRVPNGSVFGMDDIKRGAVGAKIDGLPKCRATDVVNRCAPFLREPTTPPLCLRVLVLGFLYIFLFKIYIFIKSV
jgi:hypothetical protein